MASARVDINDDDFKANGKATWSLKNKTYDPAILRELEMEVIDESELRRPVLVNPISSSSAVAPSTSESKENVEPSKPVAKKARELEAAGYCVIRHVPDRPLTKVRYMDQFGDELILMIFEWLPKNVLACCARVCKRWRRLAYDESLWVHIDLGGKKMETGVANHLLSRGLSVVRFNSTEFESPVMVPMQGPLNHVRMTASKLTLLDLSYATITANDLADLLSSCQSLKKLSLETLEISEAVCSAIGKNSQLTTLNLCMCTGVTNMCMLKIFRGCPLLDELNLGWTDLKEDVVAVTLAMAKGLVRLNISGYRSDFGDHPVRAVCNRCPRLVSLDVSDCILISDKGLKIIVDSLPQLEELFFSRCLHLTIRGVREIKRLKRLKNVQAFSVITDDGFMREMTAALPGAMINKTFFSTIARPTVGIRRTSIWGHRTR